MKIIVISNSDDLVDEHHIIEQLFEEGLDCFHLRKPYKNIEELEQFMTLRAYQQLS